MNFYDRDMFNLFGHDGPYEYNADMVAYALEDSVIKWYNKLSDKDKENFLTYGVDWITNTDNDSKIMEEEPFVKELEWAKNNPEKVLEGLKTNGILMERVKDEYPSIINPITLKIDKTANPSYVAEMLVYAVHSMVFNEIIDKAQKYYQVKYWEDKKKKETSASLET